MPDVFAPIAVLCLAALACRTLGPAERAGAVALGTVAIASHLAHLIVAAAVIATSLLWRRRALPAVPLALALAWLLASNAVGNGRLAVSPYGSVFALARLVGDGPGRAYLDRVCPDPAIRLCAWQGRLTADSDDFLWDGYGPVWADGMGPTRYAPEAARLVPAILAAYPAEAAAAAARNTVRQLGLVAVGDTLGPQHLDEAVLPRLTLFLPPREAAAFTASRQARGVLHGVAPWPLLLLGALGTVGVLAFARQPPWPQFAALILAGVLANAFATGALSGPHDRYQARIAWLVLLPPLAYAARAATSAGLIRTRES